MNRPKGTKDIYGRRQEIRQFVLDTVKTVAEVYNFKRIDTPIFERSEAFIKAVGETSDIVSKEMYSFKDKKDRSMTLRPEGTAGTIRAIVENKLFAESLPLKVFYEGPMFRYENPQKGRQRQFTQFGVEMISERNPYADAEVIMMGKMILDSLKIPFNLVINSLGDKETRENYSKALKDYFKKYKDELTKDSLNRLETNPMRILDDKVDGKKDFVKKAPKISEFYNDETKTYFKAVTSFLESSGVEYTIDTNLVRGLDYYTDTAFEFISTSKEAGSQSTILGGGRYGNLVKQFGGPDLSGVGFGLGIERLVNDVESMMGDSIPSKTPHVYVMNLLESTMAPALGITTMLRQAGFIVEWNQKPSKLNKLFEKADKTGALAKIIAGEKELKEGKVNVKIGKEQTTVEIDKLIDFLDLKLSELSHDHECGEECEHKH